MSVLLPLWAWAKKHPVLAFVLLPLLIVLAVVLVLWRVAAGDRDEARRERDDARARESAARESAKRGEALRADEAHARREHEAAVKALDERQRKLDAERAEAAATPTPVLPYDAEGLAREVEERIRSGRLP